MPEIQHVREQRYRLGVQPKVVDLARAVEAFRESHTDPEEDFQPNPDFYTVSFRERSGEITLVARWEAEECTIDPCSNPSTHYDEEHEDWSWITFCPLHNGLDFPDMVEGTDDTVDCAECEKPATARWLIAGDRVNLCDEHAGHNWLKQDSVIAWQKARGATS